jgi:hypothetical protein
MVKKNDAVWVTTDNGEVIPAIITKVSFDKGFQIYRYDAIEVLRQGESRFAYHWKGAHQLQDRHISKR